MSKPLSERIIFLLDMDAFFASCEQARDPSLKGRPVIVCGNPKTRTVVAACSYEAKGYGIGNGMSVHEALSLCPFAILVPGHPQLYTDLAGRIFEELQRWTPLVEIVSVDEAYLDVTDTWDRFGVGSPEGLARRIQTSIGVRHGLSCTIGIAPNKLLAKLAAKQNKPHGLGRIHPGSIPGCLEALPVDALNGIGPNLAGSLGSIGVITLGQLADLPVGFLRRRFGIVGQFLHQHALGIDESPVCPVDLPSEVKSMGHSYTLEQDSCDSAVIRGTLLKLSERVGRRLRGAGLFGKTVNLTVRLKDFSTFSRQRTLGEGINRGQGIYQVALELLRKFNPGRRPVRLLGVSVSHLTQAPNHPDLWEDYRRSQRLTHCLDQVNDLFGEGTIFPAAVRKLTVKTKGYFSGSWYREIRGHTT